MILPDGGLQLAALEEQALQPGTKGLPITAAAAPGRPWWRLQRWNVLRGRHQLPGGRAQGTSSAAAITSTGCAAFCAALTAPLLAPHGKTTMSPQLFGAQLANGAWGITLGHRYRRCRLARRVSACAACCWPTSWWRHADLRRASCALLRDDPGFELFALADSLAGRAAPGRCRARRRRASASAAAAGRTGHRRPARRLPPPLEAALALARRRSPRLAGACSWPASKPTRACWSPTTAPRDVARGRRLPRAAGGRPGPPGRCRERLFGGPRRSCCRRAAPRTSTWSRVRFRDGERPLAAGASRSCAAAATSPATTASYRQPDWPSWMRARDVADGLRPAARGLEHRAVAPRAHPADPHHGQARCVVRPGDLPHARWRRIVTGPG
jgi:hypothetical protein